MELWGYSYIFKYVELIEILCIHLFLRAITDRLNNRAILTNNFIANGLLKFSLWKQNQCTVEKKTSRESMFIRPLRKTESVELQSNNSMSDDFSADF